MKHLGRRCKEAADQALAQVYNKAGAMLGTDGGPVAPGLAPAFCTIGIDDVHQYKGAVAKGTKSDLDRRLNRNTKTESLDGGQSDGLCVHVCAGVEVGMVVVALSEKRGSGRPHTPTLRTSSAPASGSPCISASLMFWLAVVI